jgi:hypothetical protein
LGPPAVSLSGGLDSRAILASTDESDSVISFCFYDGENYEFEIAKRIATAAKVKFVPLKRNYDYYADNAELGVMISGGMGNIGSNHYLGFREELQNIGIQNIIAGFYFDVMFKSLLLNKKYNRISGKDKLSDFNYGHYEPAFWLRSIYSKRVQERLNVLFPLNLQKDNSDLSRLIVESKRIFPLYYESDNPETVVPQRVMQLSLPALDNDIINVYAKILPQHKTNASIFLKTVAKICNKDFQRIPDTNTGARIDASQFMTTVYGYKNLMTRLFKKLRKGIVSDDSWPNWTYYLHNSEKILKLWEKRNRHVEELLDEIFGTRSYDHCVQNYKGESLKLFLRILTIKLWLNQRF